MATRMQQRRGTAAQWLSTNNGDGPILEIGEIGFESDTGKFKMGDGVNHWIDLEYFINEAAIVTDIEGAISDTEKGAANGVATLDANSKLTASQIPTTVAPLASPTFTGTVSGITKSMVGLGNVDNTADADKPISSATQTALNAKAPTASPTFTGTVNAAAVSTTGNVTVGGNLTVNGTTTTVNSTEVNIQNAFVFEGTTDDAYETTLTVVDPTADRTITLPNVSGTVITTGNLSATGATSTELGYLAGVTSAIQTQIDGKSATGHTHTISSITDITADAAEINKLDGLATTATELGYVFGVTSAIQTQLDNKRENSNDVVIAATKVVIFEGTTDDAYETTLTVTDPTADRIVTIPNATGTVVLHDATQTLTNKTITGADNTISITASSVSDFTEAAQDAVGNSLGSGLSYNDSTGAVSVDTTTIQARVSGVSDTEIGYLDGVTSSIQTQLDAKVASSSLGSGVATFLSTPSSANLAAALTDEDGSASGTPKVLFSNAPTIVAPSIQNPRITSYAGDASIIFEGTTENAFETFLTPTDPTADRTITLPDVTGTVITTGDSGTVTSTMIADGTIVNADINASAAIALSKLATDPLARANHTGTQTANTISDFDTQVRTSKVTDLTAPTGSFSMNSQKITNLADPTADQDAATKAYVDAATAGLNVHQSVKAATTANITLASAVENGDTLDGVTLATGNRILVKNQTTQSQNGIYIVAASGAPTRATDYDTAGEVDAGDFVYVESGTVNGTTGWVQTNTITTVGTDAIAFTQFSGAGTYTAGTGLTLTGSTFSINTATTADLSTAQTLTNKTINGSNNTITNVSLTSGVTGTLPVANGGTGVTSSTGTGSVVLSSSPTLVTPALGTPSSVTLTNATGLPVSSGISGLGTGVATFLATPSSSNLASAVTDETGSGSLVFATSPTLVTPTLGAASATSIAFSDGTQSKEGVPSRTPINAQSGTTYTTVLSDRDSLVECSNASAITVTIPPNSSVAYPVGTSIDILQTGAGQVTIAAGSGVTVNATPGLKLRAQWSSATLFKRATDTWVVMGDLSA